MHKIGICGHFGFKSEINGGQTIKTRIISKELKQIYGENDVLIVDTDKWKRNPINLLIKCILLSVKCKNVIILPAQNGLKLFIPLFLFLSSIFNTRLHYIVIGAWLADELQNNSLLLWFAKKVDFIYVETTTLKNKLSSVGVLSNLKIMPNFKSIKPVDNIDIYSKFENEFKLCIVSRVNYEKGIEDAINVVARINDTHKRKIVTLDIYGPVEHNYKSKFNELVNDYSPFISYKGILEYDSTTEVISEYFLLLFPTKYYTEGIPGTIVDAFYSGTPILASRWESCFDIIEEGKTGITFDFNNSNDFYDRLNFIVNNPHEIIRMKKYCITEAKKYTPENAMRSLIKNLL
jgi:glycosyltransferase involved in cell wall biosynthesis